ncbi:MAG: DUF5686 and carboxypeptidase regulatory-like domain-containing protein [Cyclobacteriaceae bacterium]
MILLTGLSYGQSDAESKISGRVVDENGEGLPFATIYIENTTNGSTSNVNGYFSIVAPEGLQRVVFQFVGYKKKVVEVDNTDSSEELFIRMEVETFSLQELVVNANQEDPAYKVIREAIKKRKYYQDEINAFQCDAYLKGLQAITQKPDKILGFKIPIDSGIVYLSESVSKLYYERPEKIKEVMVSSKVSGSNSAFSYNIASDVLFNPYQNIFEYESISQRGFISPIAANALLFYNYKLEGTIVENGLLINKIKVIPKRVNDPVFNGTIYIIEDEWRIHSVDLLLTKSNQIEFIDSIKVKQVYAPVPEKNVWTLLSQRFEFQLEAFGFKGFGYFIGVYSDYYVEPNYRLLMREGGFEIPKKDQVKLFANSRKFFNNEILKISDNANKRDSSYWSSIRPVPLTDVEKNDYTKGDSLNSIRDSKAYKDSLDRLTNVPGIGSLFISGYVYSNSYEGKFLRFQPITRILLYNTVEGAVFNLKTVYSKRNKDGIDHQIVPHVRYGFGSKKLTANLTGYYYTNLKKFERVGLGGGTLITQINDKNPIRPETNTFQTLVFRRNYIKLYEKRFIEPSYRREVVNGLLLNTSFEYARRTPLDNTSFYSIFLSEEERAFTSNTPGNQLLSNTAFNTHDAAILNASLRYRFNQKYITRPGRKIILPTNSPELTLTYRKGISVFGSTLDYDWMSLSFRNSTGFGLLGKARYAVSVGAFLHQNELLFPDYHHFEGNRSTVTVFTPDVLQLLNYYTLSTNDKMLEFHYEHHFNGFFINKLPYVRKSKVQLVVSFNYVTTPSITGYYEFGLSLEHILKVLRAGYYISYQDGEKVGAGMRIGVGF